MTKPAGHVTGSTPNPTGPLVETLKFGGPCGGSPAASAVSQHAVATATATAPDLDTPRGMRTSLQRPEPAGRRPNPAESTRAGEIDSDETPEFVTFCPVCWLREF